MIIICQSHRVRQAVLSRISTPLQSLYSFRHETGRGCYDLTEQQWESVKDIKGVRKSRLKRSDLHKTWDIEPLPKTDTIEEPTYNFQPYWMGRDDVHHGMIRCEGTLNSKLSPDQIESIKSEVGELRDDINNFLKIGDVRELKAFVYGSVGSDYVWDCAPLPDGVGLQFINLESSIGEPDELRELADKIEKMQSLEKLIERNSK